MLTPNRENLLIFINFFSDNNLPKFKKEKNVNRQTFSNIAMGSLDGDFVSTPVHPASGFSDDGWLTNRGGIIRVKPEDEALWDGLNINTKNSVLRQYITENYDYLVGNKILRPKNFFAKVTWKIVKKYYSKKYIQKSTGKIEDFFINVKNSVQELSKIETRLENYKTAYNVAIKNGQNALADKIKEQLYIVTAETQLFAIDQKKFIEEKALVSFVLKCKRGLRLDWIKNFTRTIPDNILKIKEHCDELAIFDNYCILHYDPDNKSNDLTKKEKERRKDPVLFGLIKDSRRLYFVGDWVDELCDLTLSEIVKVIGDKKIETISDKINFK